MREKEKEKTSLINNYYCSIKRSKCNKKNCAMNNQKKEMNILRTKFVRFAKKERRKLFRMFLYIKNKLITLFSMYQILDYREEYIHHQVIQ